MKVLFAISLSVLFAPLFNCVCHAQDNCVPAVVVASSPAFSNVCAGIGAEIHVFDLKELSTNDAIWIAENADVILVTYDFEREELGRISKMVGVECLNYDCKNISPKEIERLISIIHKQRERRIRRAETVAKRNKMSLGERIAEFNARLENEECGPFHFKEVPAVDVFNNVLQKINYQLGSDSEFALSGSYSSKDETLFNRRCTLSIPRMPPMKMFRYLAEQLNCSITNRNGFIEMEQLSVPAAKANPNIINGLQREGRR